MHLCAQRTCGDRRCLVLGRLKLMQLCLYLAWLVCRPFSRRHRKPSVMCTLQQAFGNISISNSSKSVQ
eukprot:scaffold853_cov21-Tisochrysis_lutea.AAC.2